MSMKAIPSELYEYVLFLQAFLCELYKYVLFLQAFLSEFYKYVIFLQAFRSELYKYVVFLQALLGEPYKYVVFLQAFLSELYKYVVFLQAFLSEFYKYVVFLQAFLSELYVYLLDQMHVGLNKFLLLEDESPIPEPLTDVAQLKLFAREAEVNENFELAAKFYQEVSVYVHSVDLTPGLLHLNLTAHSVPVYIVLNSIT